MHSPIDHHFLPRFYLERWTAADGKLWRYYRPYGAVVASAVTPKNTGFEPHLYSLLGVPPEERAAIETDYMANVVDGPGALVMATLIAGDFKSLSVKDRESWTRFLMAMNVRTPQGVQDVAALAERVVRQKLERSDDAEFSAVKPEGAEEATVYEYVQAKFPNYLPDFYKQMLPGLIEHEKLGTVLMNMRWAVYDCSSSKHSLLTCDRPLTFSHGWGDARTIMAFPLSPTKLFCAAHDIHLLRRLDSQSRADIVKQHNEMAVRVAVDSVFGSSAHHLSFIEKRLRRLDEEPLKGPIGRPMQDTISPWPGLTRPPSASVSG